MRTLVFALAFILTATLNADTIRIGAVLPLLGDAASLGEPMREGLLMKMKELDNNPDLLNQYELIIEEGSYDMKSALMATRRQLDVNKADALLSFGGEYSKVMVPIAKREKCIHIGMSGNPVEASDGEYNFSFAAIPELLAKHLADYSKSAGYTRPYMMTMRINSAVKFSEAIGASLEEAEIPAIGESFVNPGEHDFRMVIEKAMQNNPDILIVNYKSPEQDIFLRQLGQLYPDMPTTSIAFYDDIEHPGELIEGMPYIAQGHPSDSFNQKVVNEGLKPRSYQANFYIMFGVLIDAYEAAARGDVANPSEYLRSIENYSSDLGPITTTAEGVISIKPALVEVKDGKRVQID